MDKSFCETCKRRLSFQTELLKWDSNEQYKVWEMEGELDTAYRVTSFQMEWKEHSSYVHVVVDITDEKRNVRNLTSKENRDPLTGIKNRSFFEEYMEIVLCEELEATLCYLKLDGLEEVNEVLGHQAGDDYIQNVVEIVRKNFRGGDTFARIGGDEFCVVLTGNMAELMNRKLAEILREFEEEFYGKYQCSFSYGIVEINERYNEISLDEILKDAKEVLNAYRDRKVEKHSISEKR